MRYANGEVFVMNETVATNGFGQPWGHTLSYSNRLDANYQGPNGDGWFIKEVPQLGKDASGNIAVIGIIQEPLWFDKSGSDYVARYFIKETLSEDTTNKEFTFTDTEGRLVKFFSFDASIPTAKQGQFKGFTDPSGNAANITYDGSNRISEFIQGSVASGINVRYKYDYFATGDHTSRIQYVTVKRNDTINVARVVNDYYNSSSSSGSGDSFGTGGDLKRVTVQSWNAGTSAWEDVQSSYYRYYKAGDANGFEHGLKYVVGPEAYARMVAAGLSPITTSDTNVAAYADHYFEYDSSKRVTREKVRGGLQTIDFAYAASPNAPPTPANFNDWRIKTTETLPDSNQNVVFANHAGQPMFKMFKSGTQEWYQHFKYDTAGRVLQRAESNAVSTLDSSTSSVASLKASAGLIQVSEYYTTTDVPNGAVAGYLKCEKVKQGDSGTEIKIKEYKYTSRTVGNTTIYPLLKEIVYPSDTDQSITQETVYSYTWFSNTLRTESRTITWPAVTTAQNGSNSTTSRVEWFDAYGRMIWLKDERGFITRWKHDESSGGLTQRIDDVNTTTVSDEPSGWVTPSGGGLHLVTDFEHDNVGRMTQELGPSHSIDLSGTATTLRRAKWIVYKDTIQERWEAMGYATGTAPSYTYTLINPVTITKMDRARRVAANVVATRASTSGKLSASDSFAQSTWVRWRKFNYDNNSRLTFERLYHLIPTSGEGSSGTNYNQTDYEYDSRLRRKKTKSPGGTIRRTVFHVRGWELSTWIGTDDTGATDTNPAGSGSPNNMVKVEEREYDSGADKGDGLLTEVTLHENASTTRVTTFSYDWRNRREHIDGEIDFYQTDAYDNLNRVTRVDQKDSAGTLIGRTETKYDNRGRVYQTIDYEVNPTNGTVGNSLTHNIWYDAALNVIKQKVPGSSALQKMVYDGLNRMTRSYVSYDTAETSYADAGTVVGDTVMQQSELIYDAASNVIEQKTGMRFHDADGTTGELGNPSTEPKARISYMAVWPDPLGQAKNIADYGTNGGSALSRPSTAPARSDTVLVTTTEYNTRGEMFQTKDPKGTTMYFEFDHAGQMTKQIENYVDGVPSLDTDKTTQFAYNADGRLKALTAVNSVTGDQVTKYAYGTTLSDSDLASNDLLRATIYPDSDDVESPLGNGTDAVYDRVEFKYNRLGEMTEKKDQLQTVHVFEYDKLGRPVHDRVTAFGTGVDQAVRRISRSYEVRGMLSKITSYDNAAVGSGNVVNEVQFDYNNFSQLTADHQSHSGAVVPGTTPQVQYAYASGAANHIRPTSITYPDGRVTDFDYGTANEVDDLLSRISALKHSTTTMVQYTRLGVDRTVKASYSTQPGVDLTYLKQTGESNGDAGDRYTGLDRFGRVVDQRWIKTSDGTHRERVKYGFDRASNRLWRENLVATSGQDEFYTYDGLYQLTNMDRGDLNGTYTGISGTPTREEDFAYDPTGNWRGSTTGYLTKTNGTTDLDQNRSHNKANEISGITTNSGSAWAAPAQNLVGNMTTIPQPLNLTSAYTCTYDAWNRLVTVQSGGTTIAAYQYDGNHRRTLKITSGGTVTRHYYYSDQWQVLEERLGTSSTADRQFVWGLRYADDLVLRDRGSERLYALHDYFHVTAVIGTTGAVQERYGYDSYGNSRVMDASFNSASSSYDWETRFGAYRWDSETGLCQVRHRYLHAKLGRWLTRDPLQYEADGPNLYWFARNNSINYFDAYGLNVHPDTLKECFDWKCYDCFNITIIRGQRIPNLVFRKCFYIRKNGPMNKKAFEDCAGPLEAQFARECRAGRTGNLGSIVRRLENCFNHHW